MQKYVNEQTQFIHHELTIHLDALGKPTQTPDSVFGVSIVGDFAFAHLMLALELDRQLNQTSGSKHNYDEWIEGLLQRDASGTTFAQLFAMQTRYLKAHGPNPPSSPLSQTSNKIYAAMSDIRKFYDPATETIANNRPPNYLAVALITGTLAWKNGYETDKAMLLRLLDKCVAHLKGSGQYLSDDNQFERARYDRYGLEFNMFVYRAAKLLEAKQIVEELKPFVVFSGNLWWNLLHPEAGYAFQYGRSLQNTWDDSMEQAAFFLENPEVAPAPPEQLAAVVVQVWDHYLEHQYNGQNHLNRMLDPGRGTYSYAGRNRIWGYTIGTFSKALLCFATLKKQVEKGDLKQVPSKPVNPKSTSWIPFRSTGKPAGVWIVKQGRNRCMIPFTDGLSSKPSTDYLPAPYGLKGFSWPVSISKGFLVPEILTSQGDRYCLYGRPDSLVVGKNQKELLAYWNALRIVEGSPNTIKVAARYLLKGKNLKVEFQAESSLENLVEITLSAWTTSAAKQLSKNSVAVGEEQIFFSTPIAFELASSNENGAFSALKDKLKASLKLQAPSATTRIGYEVKFK